MRNLTVCLLALLLVAGCSKPDEDPIPAGQGKVTNPSGKPRNATETAVAQGQQQAGDRSNQEMAAAADAMRRAQGK